MTVKYQEIVERVYTTKVLLEALEITLGIMRSRKESAMARLAAVDRVENRTLGKAVERREHSGTVTIEVVTDGDDGCQRR